MTSPEIVMSTRFNKDVLQSSVFSSRLCLLAIDELHLVHEWRNFRPEYYNLAILRLRLPEGIPFLGVSATIDTTILATVLDRCGFQANTRIIRTSLDRPEIFLQASSLQYSAQSMLDLQFLLPPTVNSAQSIPKTVIFMDLVASIRQAVHLFQKWMRQLNYPSSASNWVSPFFSDMADSDKTRVSQEFERLSPLCERPRILIATDAYGLGIDNPDIERVVQWLHPASMARLFQRLGRAVRSGQRDGNFVLLFQPWCIGPRGEGADREDEELESFQQGSKGRKLEEQRQKLPFGIWQFINPPYDSCLRKVGLRYFNDPFIDSIEYRNSLRCCSKCHPHQQLSTDTIIQSPSGQGRDGSKRSWYLQKIEAWRKTKAEDLFQGLYFEKFPSLILPDSIVDQMILDSERITDKHKLKECIGSSWGQIEQFSTELLNIFQYGQQTPIDQGELFEVWKREQDIKRKRIPRPIVNQALEDFQKRREKWIQEHFPGKESKKEPKRPKASKSLLKDQHYKEGQGRNKKRKQDSQSQTQISNESSMIESGKDLAHLEDKDPAYIQNEDPVAYSQQELLEDEEEEQSPRTRVREPLEVVEVNVSTLLPPSRSRSKRRVPARYL